MGRAVTRQQKLCHFKMGMGDMPLPVWYGMITKQGSRWNQHFVVVHGLKGLSVISIGTSDIAHDSEEDIEHSWWEGRDKKGVNSFEQEADLLFLSKFSFNSKWKNTIKVRPVRQSIRRTEINIRRGWQPDRFPFSKSCRLTFGAGRGSMRFSISCRPNVGPRKQLWKCRCVLMLFRVLQSSLRLYPKICKRYMPFSIIDGQP
jgi:hypothetical protein